LSVAFAAILALYLWEDRHGKLEEPPEAAGPLGPAEPAGSPRTADDHRPADRDQKSGKPAPGAGRE
jgi:hypothetical protein